jgi:hypothetical protein
MRSYVPRAKPPKEGVRAQGSLPTGCISPAGVVGKGAGINGLVLLGSTPHPRGQLVPFSRPKPSAETHNGMVGGACSFAWPGWEGY